MELPLELREYILGHVVEESGTIALQAPIWSHKTVYTQPITQVCRQLRSEAIDVFWKVNMGYWWYVAWHELALLRLIGAVSETADKRALFTSFRARAY